MDTLQSSPFFATIANRKSEGGAVPAFAGRLASAYCMMHGTGYSHFNDAGYGDAETAPLFLLPGEQIPMSETKSDDERRLSMVFVSSEFIWFHLFTNPQSEMIAKVLRPKIIYRGEEVAWDKCKIVGVHYDFNRNAFALTLQSPDFAVHSAGDVIERSRMDVEVEMVAVREILMTDEITSPEIVERL